MKQLEAICRQLGDAACRLSFAPPVAFVYNPLSYARDPLFRYISRYARKGTVLLVGMNPGPFGMAQTGVPFGDVSMVRDFLNIEGTVIPPVHPHPKRPVDGFLCPRREVSGRRLWGFAQERFGTANAFFDHFFVVNYCPLVFMEDTGRNITPDKLRVQERRQLFLLCDTALRETAQAMATPYVVGVGAFAATACSRALKGLDIPIGRILHPSPASPAANRGWNKQAETQLRDLGVLE